MRIQSQPTMDSATVAKATTHANIVAEKVETSPKEQIQQIDTSEATKE